MKADFQLDEMNSKQRVMIFFFPLWMAVFSLRFSKIITGYLEGQNWKEKKTFSQFGGKYQRNLFTLIQTRRYLMVCVSLVFLDNFVIIMLEVYRKELMKETQFIIYNILWIVLSDIFFGVYVPLKHIFLSRRTLSELCSEYGIVQTSRFYVSKQSFIPKRYV